MDNGDSGAEPALTTPENQIGFLDLPSEIRLRVYHYMFSSDRISISVRAVGSDCVYTSKWIDYPRILYNPRSKFIHTYRLFGSRASRPYILLTCRTVFKEGRNVFLDNADLHYGVSTSTTQAEHIVISATQQSDIDNGTQARGEDVHAKHVAHGSNIVLLNTDLMKVKRIYDNMQMSYTRGFQDVILRATPKIETLTIRRNWDTVCGQHSGKHRDIKITIDYNWLSKSKYNDNLVFLGIHVRGSKHDTASRRTRLSSAVLLSTTSSLTSPASGDLSSSSYGTIRVNIHDMVRYYQIIDLEERKRPNVYRNDHESQDTAAGRRSCSNYILRQSRQARGFQVHMAVTFDLFINNMILDHRLLSDPRFIDNAEVIDQDQKPLLLARWIQEKASVPSTPSNPHLVAEKMKPSKTPPMNSHSIDSTKTDKGQAISAAKAAWLAANPTSSPFVSSSVPAPRARNLDPKVSYSARESRSTRITDQTARFHFPTLESKPKEALLELGTILYAKIDVKYDFDTLEIVELNMNRVPLRQDTPA